MSQSLDIISFSVLVLSFLYGLWGLRNTSLMTKFNMTILLSYLGYLVIIGSEVGLYLGQLNIIHFFVVLSALLPFLYGLLTVQVGFLVIGEVTKKKITTLYKTPLLGLLAGLFLEIRFAPWLCLGFLAISFYLLFKKRDTHQYFLKSLFPVFGATIFVFLIKPDQIYLLNAGLVFLLVSTKLFHNSAIASNLFRRGYIEEA